MSAKKKPKRVKLIIGMLAKNKKLFEKAEKPLVRRFGEIDYRSPVLSFNHTDYYKKEMGHPLKRKFISFTMLISPQDISKIKTVTNSIEKIFSRQKKLSIKRQLNLDPGYISDSKLILGTTKDYFHRIYLQNGIYGEVTLIWKKGSFHPFSWTYPDYKTAEYINILNHIRNTYMKQRHAVRKI